MGFKNYNRDSHDLKEERYNGACAVNTIGVWSGVNYLSCSFNVTKITPLIWVWDNTRSVRKLVNEILGYKAHERTLGSVVLNT